MLTPQLCNCFMLTPKLCNYSMLTPQLCNYSMLTPQLCNYSMLTPKALVCMWLFSSETYLGASFSIMKYKRNAVMIIYDNEQMLSLIVMHSLLH